MHQALESSCSSIFCTWVQHLSSISSAWGPCAHQIPVRKLQVLGLWDGAAWREFMSDDVFLCEFKNLNFEVREAYAGLCKKQTNKQKPQLLSSAKSVWLNCMFVIIWVWWFCNPLKCCLESKFWRINSLNFKFAAVFLKDYFKPDLLDCLEWHISILQGTELWIHYFVHFASLQMLPGIVHVISAAILHREDLVNFIRCKIS